MKASVLRSSLLMVCLLLSLAGQGVCEDRRVMRYGSTYSDSTDDFSFAIVEFAAMKLNWKVDVWECPWKRCLLMMESGDLDMLGSLFKTQEREKGMFYVEPPYVSEMVAFYFQKSLGSQLTEYKDLKGLTIGVTIGQKYFEPFDSDSALDKFEMPWVSDQFFKMLKSGRIETFIDNEYFSDRTIKNSRFKDLFEKAPYRVKAGNDYFAISKKSPYFKDRFKFAKVLKQIIESGKVKEIFNKQGYEWHPPTQQAPK